MKKDKNDNVVTKVKEKDKFDPFAYEHLFYEYELEITDVEINQILFLVQNVDKKDQKTTYQYLNVLNFPVVKNLKNQIISILDKHKLYLADNWAQLYNKDDKHPIHTHPGSRYSGIIYLKGINSSPTYFYNSLFDPYTHRFKKNTLLMFPSHIPHEVKPLPTNEERLIISFNTNIDP
jgi:hypothetical protein|tara:strand:+ start:566 stop:1096 length:531 start_codon:yes stop_codon:yes gene_type:complete